MKKLDVYSDPLRRLRPGKASDYIRDAIKEIRRGDKVILCCRVSCRTQKDNLRDQEAKLRRYMKKLGAIVVCVCSHVWSNTDPFWLTAEVAKAKKCGAKLVAETTDRFIRHHAYHPSKYPDAQARTTELEYLRKVTHGVTLVTLLHPDASPGKAMSSHRKRGRWAKGNKGGRPKVNKPGYKKQRRQKFQPQVLRLAWAGNSLSEISALTGVRRSTAHDWITKNS